ncbi:MAG: tol-pal system YbgF family protein [Polyangiaceae bacterium]
MRVDAQSCSRRGRWTAGASLRRWVCVCFCAGVLTSCGGSEQNQDRPEAVLAESQGSQAAFRRIAEAWYDRPDTRLVLQQPLERFIRRFPEDEQVRRAMVYLAWIHVEKGELSKARQLARATRAGALGSVHDLADIVEAAIRIRLGQPKAALALLEPLEGKLIEPSERALYREQLVTALLKDERWHDAAAAMLRWAADTPIEERELVHTLIEHRMDAVPPKELEATLHSLSEGDVGPELESERDWMRSLLITRLSNWAIEQRDGELARRLLGERPMSEQQAAQRVELARLAAQGGRAPSVRGRAVGLVLSTGSVERQRRSAALAAGVTRALGLPQSGRDPGHVQLVSAEENGDPGAMQQALAELAGAGASILIAGVDAQGSKRALEFARGASVPVILVVPTSGAEGRVFAIGVDPASSKRLLLAEFASRGLKADAVTSEICLALPARAGASRFPFGKWQREGVAALLVEGSASCASDLAREIKRKGQKTMLGLDLLAADAFSAPLAGVPRVSVSAGAFPLRENAAGELGGPKSMREFRAQSGGGPEWLAALGADAARLAQAALKQLPVSTTREREEVAQRHDLARSALSQARVRLWTSDARGFDSSGRIPRQLTLIAH